MKAPEAYRLWLQRRIEEGNDLDRCRRQIEAWKANPPADTNAALLADMLAKISKVKINTPRPKTEPSDVDAFG